MADKSLVKPNGVLEDLCFRVHKFLIPANFFILDIKEDKKMPQILIKSFLVTGDAAIKVKYNVIAFQFDWKEVVFNVDKAVKRPVEKLQCD